MMENVPRVRARKGRKSTKEHSHWTDAKKIEVVTTHLALGNAALIEAVTGVPRNTIRYWRTQEWWKEMIQEIQTEEDQQLDHRLKKVVDRSLDAVMDRIENGDFEYDRRTGEIRRVPVKLKDVHRVSSDLVDKRLLLRNKQVARRDQAAEGDRLVKLAEQFAQFAAAITGAKSGQAEPRIIEGEVIEDAVHEEWQEGLQEGSEGVYEPSGSGGKACEAECSTPGGDGSGTGS